MTQQAPGHVPNMSQYRTSKKATSRLAAVFATAAVPGRSAALKICVASSNAAAARRDGPQAAFERQTSHDQKIIPDLRAKHCVSPQITVTRATQCAADIAAFRNGQQMSAKTRQNKLKHAIQNALLLRKSSDDTNSLPNNSARGPEHVLSMEEKMRSPTLEPTRATSPPLSKSKTCDLHSRLVVGGQPERCSLHAARHAQGPTSSSAGCQQTARNPTWTRARQQSRTSWWHPATLHYRSLTSRKGSPVHLARTIPSQTFQQVGEPHAIPVLQEGQVIHQEPFFLQRVGIELAILGSSFMLRPAVTTWSTVCSHRRK